MPLSVSGAGFHTPLLQPAVMSLACAPQARRRVRWPMNRACRLSEASPPAHFERRKEAAGVDSLSSRRSDN